MYFFSSSGYASKKEIIQNQIRSEKKDTNKTKLTKGNIPKMNSLYRKKEKPPPHLDLLMTFISLSQLCLHVMTLVKWNIFVLTVPL